MNQTCVVVRLHLSTHCMVCNLQGLVVLALAGTDSLLSIWSKFGGGVGGDYQYSKNQMAQS